MPKSETRLRMVNTAIDLFHKQGVNATSVDQILAQSKTGKSQFSHYFKNKDGLVLATLVHLREIIQAELVPTKYSINSWREFEGWFDNFIIFQRSVGCSRSCPIGTIGTDITNEQIKLRSEVRQFLNWSRHEIANFFETRKKIGELSHEVDPLALADFCIAIMQGGMLLTKMDRKTEIFENAADQAITYIKMLKIKKKKKT